MADSDDDFIGRWSRRKRGAQVGAKPSAPPATGEAPGKFPAKAPAGTPPAAAETTAPAEAEAPDLPDPDTLGPDADFTVYLKENVPEAIRNRALRRLWRSDPVLANLDGLIDYGGDYTDAATVVKGLKTLYQVGRGFVVEDEEPAPDAKEPEFEPVATIEADSAPTGDFAPDQTAPAPEPSAVAPPRAETRQAAATTPKVRRRGALERRWGGVRGSTESGSE